MVMKYKTIKPLLTWVFPTLLVLSLSLLLYNQQKMKQWQFQIQHMEVLLEAEDCFINQEYERALSLYMSIDTQQFAEGFLELRLRLASSGQKASLLKLELEELLAPCNQTQMLDSHAILNMSYPDLIAMIKECYKDAIQVKQSKSEKIEDLRMISYLRFTNERGHAIHYFGPVKDSMAQGEGVGVWDNESVYQGAWSQNKREGRGLFRTAKGEVYDGEYKQDQRNGQGIYRFRNGDYYTGEWLNGQRSGFGTVISAKGDTLVHGLWSEDRFLRRKTREYFKNQNGDSAD